MEQQTDLNRQPKQANKAGSDEDLEIIMLVNAKRAGLSLEELNEFRVCDFVRFMEIYTGEADNRPRPATQDDIDKLLG